jgi:large subunit ribosomal protein L21
MSKFAIIGVGGKQYRVAEGDTIQTELVAEAGKTIKLGHVFLVADGVSPRVGSPLVDGATVEAKVLATGKADKIRVFKMKRRKRTRTERGHRQPFAKLEITKINA